MSLKNRIKKRITERVAKQPVSAFDLELMRRENGGGLHCKKEWFDANVKELVEEGKLLYTVPK